MAQSNAITLTPFQQNLVERLVQSGRFEDVEDVVTAGLTLLEKREAQVIDFIGELETEIEKGLRSGEASAMEPAVDLLASFRSRG